MSYVCTMFFALGVLVPCEAEVFVLKNGDRLTGELKSFRDGVYTVLVGQEEKSIPLADVAAIEASPRVSQSAAPAGPSSAATPPPSKPSAAPLSMPVPSQATTKYGSPRETFEVWRQAAIVGDIDGMVGCYVSYQQKSMKKQLRKIAKQKRKEMAEVARRTEFIPAEPVYQGDRATVEVTWRTGLQTDSQVLQFILENNAWKLIQAS